MKDHIVYELILIICLLCINKLNSQIPKRYHKVSISQEVKVSAHRGKRFRFRGMVKVQPNSRDTHVSLFVKRTLQDGSQADSLNYSSSQPSTSPDWQSYALEGTIHSQSQTISLGMECYYGGRFFFDEFRLEIQEASGQWVSVGLQNGGFEQWEKEGKVSGWSGTIGSITNFQASPWEDAFKGKYALLIASSGEKYIDCQTEVVPLSTKVEHITTDDGLPHANVYAILKDRKGFMWFGTMDGLARYDGYSFVVYRHLVSDTNSISGNFVFSLLEDSNGGLWAGTGSDGLNYFDREIEQFTRFQHDPLDASSLGESGGAIRSIFQDNNQQIWITTESREGVPGTVAGTLNKYMPATKSFKRYPMLDAEGRFMRVNHVESDGLNRLWVSSDIGGLFRFEPETGCFFSHAMIDNEESGPWDILDFLLDEQDQFWIASFQGLWHFDPISGQFEKYQQAESETPGLYRNSQWSISKGNRESLWVGWVSGVSRFDVKKNQFQVLEHNNEDPEGFKSEVGLCIFSDEEGITWIGAGYGVERINPLKNQFQAIPNINQFPYQLDQANVNAITEDQLGNIWVAAEREGLVRISPEGEWTSFPLDQEFSRTITGLFAGQNGLIWMADDLGTFGYIDPSNKKPSKVVRLGVEAINSVLSFAEGNDGRIWLATVTLGGLHVYDPTEESLQRWMIPIHNHGMGMFFTVLRQETNGSLWLATSEGGLFRYHPESNRIHDFSPQKVDSGQASGTDNICGMTIDRKGNVWVGTNGNGLWQIDTVKGTLVRFTEEDGLSSNHVYSILEDDKGFLWLGTTNGLSRFDPHTQSFRNYYTSDGLPPGSEVMNYPNIAHKHSKTGVMYIGTTKGLVAFHPDSIRDNTFIPPIVISSLYRYNIDEGDEPIPVRGIAYKSEITLSYKDDLLIFEFAALSYAKTQKNQYAYQMEGLSDQWIQLGTRRDVTFTNLLPGSYTLHVKGSNGDGLWNEKGTSLRITITPPWYWSPWTKSLYALLAIALLYGLYRLQLSQQLALAESIRLSELDQVKTRLYTNITHEFRTPLTVIQGINEKIAEKPSTWVGKGTDMIRRNSRQLLRLVNQMLDLSKLESGKLSLHLIQGDIIPYLQYLVESFHSFAETKGIELDMSHDIDSLIMDYDPDRLRDVVSNLLSNAIKFTSEGGYVCISLESTGQMLQIEIRDTGIGIPEEKLAHIFDRFYQADDSSTRQGEGTGIGLTLTRELVHLMQGQISVQSTADQGTSFIVSLPITCQAKDVDYLFDGEKAVKQQIPFHSPGRPILIDENLVDQQMPLALIVEDHEDVVNYLITCLQGSYRIEISRNGQQGINMAQERVPDIIISDVMMPQKDGFELCDTLKQDIRTSHIPIVMLTAKSDVSSRIEGLKRGADAYLAKPFSEEELLVRMKSSLSFGKH